MFLLLWRILGIVCLACLAALIQRSFIPDEPAVVFVREPHGGAPATTPAANPEATPQPQAVTIISAARAYEIREQEAVQFIDARNETDFKAGHLPQAIDLPLASFATGMPDALKDLIPEVPTIVYCEGGECESSMLVARKLVAAGFESVMVIDDGYPGWVAGGFPVETTSEEGDVQ